MGFYFHFPVSSISIFSSAAFFLAKTHKIGYNLPKLMKLLTLKEVTFMTIYDISEKAGVSIATVSRVLNGSTSVSEKTRQKVLEVMSRYGYTGV